MKSNNGSNYQTGAKGLHELMEFEYLELQNTNLTDMNTVLHNNGLNLDGIKKQMAMNAHMKMIQAQNLSSSKNDPLLKEAKTKLLMKRFMLEHQH